ncbi:DUF4167 domain-containing protein [Rhizorhabdus sp. FW153]|uniref:DUF4167 domain-containing protein n=1 Tax=Rhizorhabdus sp. FW153 TaxID=3400216 RepID=UPI003CF0AF22
MINNRQNGRRRGRGGGSGAPRPNGGNGGQDRGNRIDNRARGNAAQLLEKYKALARDAQMQGDRVNTEYYLQFADHYFRVLSESRSRFEDQQPRPRRDDFSMQSDEDYGDEGERVSSDEVQAPRGDEQGDQRRRDGGQRYEQNRYDQNRYDQDGERQQQRSAEEGEAGEGGERRPRRGRPPRGERRYDGEQQARRQDEVEAAPVAEATPAPLASEEGEERPVRRRGRPPKVQPSEQLDADRLPPSLSQSVASSDDGEDAPKPRVTRTRKPRGEAAAV